MKPITTLDQMDEKWECTEPNSAIYVAVGQSTGSAIVSGLSELTIKRIVEDHNAMLDRENISLGLQSRDNWKKRCLEIEEKHKRLVDVVKKSMENIKVDDQLNGALTNIADIMFELNKEGTDGDIWREK